LFDHLEDKAHSIMVEQYLKLLKKSFDYHDLRVEEPYDYYGYRGRVDIVCYFTLDDPEEKFDVLSVFEIKTKIWNLQGELGKFKEYAEYFTKTFIEKKGISPDWYWNNLILLDTKENRELVFNYWDTFGSVFEPRKKVIKAEYQLTPTHPTSLEPILKNNFLFFYDPIKNKSVPVIFGKLIRNGKEVDTKEEILREWQFLNPKDFLKTWTCQKDEGLI